ncbi:MAG TPA: beta-CASP ribonuclease aCPSF1 [Nitrososphaeria archaeon]|nr:MAG: beta-CASP ribonuclease aCPSF1 [Candidatus Wolframiiraptor sp.]HDD39695.1 beta-CASP ribonuclease aCPSF1 [Nitrososphaeria archaeon]
MTSQELFSLDRLRHEIARYFSVVNPIESGVTKIEFEGPRIAIYTRNPEVFSNRDQIAKDLVTLIKKRIVIRSDESIRMPKEVFEEEVRRRIKGIQDLIFNDLIGEVIVEIASGVPPPSDDEIKELSASTGWVIRVEMQPPMQTKTVQKANNIIYGYPEERLQALRRIGEKVFRNQVFETTDARITILGSGMQVGRSAILLQTNESKILLDCGFSPSGTKNMEMLPRFDIMEDLISELDAVVITHAHLDHMGIVPYLFKYDYRGPIYCTEPTLPLMLMQQLDFINVAGKEGVFAPYTEHDVRTAVQHTVTLSYGVVTNITPDIRITFYNAGHILGSAIIHIHIGEGFHNVIYTGDFKFEASRTLDPAVSRFPRAETLIMESTYGATPVQFTRQESEQLLANYIKQTLERGGKVLIPVPAVGRAQEIMLVLNHLFSSRMIPEVPVFLDGLVVEATAIHAAFPSYLGKELGGRVEELGNVFMSEYFTAVKSQQQRDEILNTREPLIIMATSGMLEGGPILTYLKEFASEEKNTLIFVSYQVEGTLGRKLLKGVREFPMINEKGKTELINVKLEVTKVDGFSGHSSRQQLLSYLKAFKPKPKKLVLVHGEPDAVMSLAKSASKVLPGTRIYTPQNLESITLETRS